MESFKTKNSSKDVKMPYERELSKETGREGIVWVSLSPESYKKLIQELSELGVDPLPDSKPYLNTTPHVTLKWKVKPSEWSTHYPDQLGKEIQLYVTGVAQNERVQAAIVHAYDSNGERLPVEKDRGNLHISLFGVEGAAPIESGKMLATNHDYVEFETPLILNGRIVFYDMERKVERDENNQVIIQSRETLKTEPEPLSRLEVEFKLTEEVKLLVETFQKYNYNLWGVGGWPRDLAFNELMGKDLKPKDMDLVTDADYKTLRNILESLVDLGWTMVTIPAQEANKIGKIIAPSGEEFEIATLRIDIGNDRKTNKSEETDDVREDLLRRDFTINSMLLKLNPNSDTQEILDYTGALDQMKEGLVELNTVGSAKEKFATDRSRIMRALRFANQYGMVFSEDISKAIKSDNRLTIGTGESRLGMSGEGKKEELFKGIEKSKDVVHYLNDLSEFGLLEQILPNLQLSLDRVKHSNQPLFVLALLLDGYNDNESLTKLGKVLNLLKYTELEIKKLKLLLTLERALSNLSDPENRKEVIELKKKYNTLLGNNQIKAKEIVDYTKLVDLPQDQVHAVMSYFAEEQVSGEKVRTDLIMELGEQTVKTNPRLIGEEIEKRELVVLAKFFN